MSAFGPDMGLVARLLDVATLRHRTIASNIANANTPGYARREVRFEEALGRALAHGGAEAGERVEARVVEDDLSPARLDGNNVAVERELVDLSKNTLLFETLARAAAAKTAMLRAAIAGRGGV